MKTFARTTLLSMSLAALLVFAGGCTHKGPQDELIKNDIVRPADVEPPVEIEEDDLFVPNRLQVVYFDFDSAAIRPDMMAAIRHNADLINKYPNNPVQIQLGGHCDERGTQEYNLALGERRALAVREQLTLFGVPAERLTTVSFGKEFPADSGHNEEAWSKNRRVEIMKPVQ